MPHSILTYAFAVCRDADAPVPPPLPGMPGGAPVRRLGFGSLTAIVQDVPAADFTDEVWQRRLTDRVELERCARAHHDVVDAVARSCATVPLALCTLYQDDQRAVAALGQDEIRFLEVLRRIAGHAEWGVKVYARPRTAETTRRSSDAAPEPVTPAATRDAEGAAAPGAGQAYLARRREQQRARARLHEDALRDTATVDETLRRVASAARRLQPQRPELTGDPRPQLLNATYLVAEDRAAELAVAVGALRSRVGSDIEVTGPWVPYSFAGEV
ncbi:gas vesicle protein [Streptomyces sp. ICBB 8177]|nr:gas vesicle protein [Streptomyces sp. ICBB 8177]